MGFGAFGTESDYRKGNFIDPLIDKIQKVHLVTYSNGSNAYWCFWQKVFILKVHAIKGLSYYENQEYMF